MQDKPYKGKIYHWKRVFFDCEDAGLGYCIYGYTRNL